MRKFNEDLSSDLYDKSLVMSILEKKSKFYVYEVIKLVFDELNVS